MLRESVSLQECYEPKTVWPFLQKKKKREREKIKHDWNKDWKKNPKNWSVTRILIEIGGMGRTFNYEWTLQGTAPDTSY